MDSNLFLHVCHATIRQSSAEARAFLRFLVSGKAKQGGGLGPDSGDASDGMSSVEPSLVKNLLVDRFGTWLQMCENTTSDDVRMVRVREVRLQ